MRRMIWSLVRTALALSALRHAVAGPAHARTVFRPNLYLGTKTSSARPVSTGLMWFAGDHVDGEAAAAGVRHAAEMGDKLKKWGWVAHDGADFGRHDLTDPDAAVQMTADFVRDGAVVGENGDGGDDNNESWTLRIRGRPLRGRGRKKEGERNDLSLVFYVTNEDGTLALDKAATARSSATVSGSATREGSFVFNITRTATAVPLFPQDLETYNYPDKGESKGEGKKDRLTAMPHSLQLRVPPNQLWRAKEYLMPVLQANRNGILSRARARRNRARKENKRREADGEDALPLPRRNPDTLPLLVQEKNAEDPSDQSNLVALQFVVAPPFELVIRFRQGALISSRINDNDDDDALSASVDSHMSAFQTRFENLFGLQSRFGYDEKQTAFAQAAFSNLIGSTTFFHGSSLVKPTHQGASPSLTSPGPLVTGVPSRSFFPRGFLWDEGFHQLLVSAWDPSVSRRVIRHWLGRMDTDGWIPREQILGAEALSKVPEQFRVQSPDIANPPAMLLTIERMMNSLRDGVQDEEEEDEVMANGNTRALAAGSDHDNSRITTLRFLAEVFPLFRRHYRWLRRTQAGKIDGTFYWRGTTDTHCLASGLDDFPRASYRSPHDRHLDLLSWMAFAAEILGRLAKLLLSTDNSALLRGAVRQDAVSAADVAEFAQDYTLYMSRMEDHWHESDGTWYDIGIEEATRDPETGGRVRYAAPSHVRHYGYVSLFPLLLQLLDPKSKVADNARLERTITRLMEPHLLWSKYGLRSLSRVDQYFGVEEDYWRGKIWININYLAIRALRKYSNEASGASFKVRALATKAHDELKQNIVRNLYKVYRRTGFVWENYSAKDGGGAGCHPFTGWSALVVAIMGGK